VLFDQNFIHKKQLDARADVLIFMDKDEAHFRDVSVEVRRISSGETFLSEAKDQTGSALTTSPSAWFAAKYRPDLELGLMLLSIGPVLILVVLIFVLSLVSPVFLTPRNVGNILAQTAVITVVAMGQHLVILTRGIDLSVGSNLALATVVGALLFHAGGSPAATILAMIASGALVGAINGLFYVFGRLPHPFIITLATLSICKGVALQLADGRAIPGMPEAIRVLGRNTSFGLPGSVFVVVGVGLVLLVLTRTMVWGRWIYAVGGRPEAALAMGIPVKWVLVSAYVISGACAGIGAVILAGRTDAGSPLFGNLLELDTIAAVIIGGASFLGGRGHLGHAVVGAIMIGVIRNALNLLNVGAFFQLIVIGVIIVIAVECDVLRNHLEARVRAAQAGRGS
jgi:ribose transport system permease protein